MRRLQITRRAGTVVASLALLCGVLLPSLPVAANSSLLKDVAYEVSNPDKSYSFVTTSQDEIKSAASKGFTSVRPIFMVSTTPGSGLIPVYRADNTLSNGNFTSLLTASKNEWTNAYTKYGFTSKGIAFYTQANQKDGTELVYRMKRKHFNFRHVVAKDRQALLDAGYVQEGREWFYVKQNDYNPTRILTIDTINNTVTSDIQAASIRDAYKAKYPNATLPTYDQYDVSYSGMNFVAP